MNTDLELQKFRAELAAKIVAQVFDQGAVSASRNGLTDHQKGVVKGALNFADEIIRQASR